MSLLAPTPEIPDLPTSYDPSRPPTMPSVNPVDLATSPNAILLAVFGLVGIALNIVPLVSLYRAKNLPATTMIFVIIVLNFIISLNAILWPNNDTTGWFDGTGLCDVEIYIRAISATLIATSTAGLTRNLAQAVDTDKPILYESRSGRRRRYISEILFCFGIPATQLVTHYVIQAGRYGIMTVWGCFDITDNSWPVLVLFLVWPPIFAILNCYYAILVIVRLRRHRGTLSSTLSSTGSSFTARKFMKLFFITLSLLILYLPVTLAFFYFNLPLPLIPYSWSRVHDPKVWPVVFFLTDADFPRTPYYGWPSIGMSIASFLFFGLNSEAIDIYRKFAVKTGLAYLWPSLRESRLDRRRNSSSGSWRSHFDVIGKALAYFDSARKMSGASMNGSEAHKGSVPTFEHMTLTTVNSLSTAPTTSSTRKSAHAPESSSSTPPFVFEKDLKTSTPSHQPSNPHQPRPFMSVFRTHFNLPIGMFSRSKQSSTTPDLESQVRRHSSSNSQTIETTIWSGPTAHGALREDDDEEIDPSEPKMGTRAYRERERREHEASMRAKQDDNEGVKVYKTLDQISVIAPES